jgi:glutathione peroxidase
MTSIVRILLIGLPLAAVPLYAASAQSPVVPGLSQKGGVMSGPAKVSRMSAHAISFAGLNGGRIDLADFAGKPVLVVNTASFCGFTNQYGALAKLHEKYKARGFSIIGVPSNDFGGQEPGGPKEITATAHEYGVSFPMAEKAVVKGPNAHRFFKWAAAERPGRTPQWNFHKYLIGADGHIAAVFDTRVKPDAPEVISAIERELAKK